MFRRVDYTEIDMLVWAKKFYGEKFVEYLKKTYSPLNVVFRLAHIRHAPHGS